MVCACNGLLFFKAFILCSVKVLQRYEEKRKSGELKAEERRLLQEEQERQEAERIQTTVKQEDTGIKGIMSQVRALFS